MIYVETASRSVYSKVKYLGAVQEKGTVGSQNSLADGPTLGEGFSQLQINQFCVKKKPHCIISLPDFNLRSYTEVILSV